MKKEVLLFTSGVDSYIVKHYLSYLGHEFDCLYFDHGGRYCNIEKQKIKELDFPVIIDDRLRLKEVEDKTAFIPNRNILFTILANSLGYEKIWIGGSKSDRVNDNNEKVFLDLSRFLTLMNEKFIKIDSPFWSCYKDDMIRWFLSYRYKDSSDKLGPIVELLMKTFSCFTPLFKIEDKIAEVYNQQVKYQSFECLSCPACFRKCAVLYSGGIFIPFKNRMIVEKYHKEFSDSLVMNPRVSGTLNYTTRWFSEGIS